MRATTPGEAAFEGKVAATIYQGDHVDVYVDSAEAASGRLLMRLAAREAAGAWSVGTAIRIAIAAEDAVAFPPERGA